MLKRYYPFIVYPAILTDFLLKNPPMALSSCNNGKKEETPKVNVEVPSVKKSKKRRRDEWIWLLFFLTGILMAFSYFAFSILWLAAMAWLWIVGGIGHILMKNKKPFAVTSAVAIPEKKAALVPEPGEQKILRSPARERQLSRLFSKKVMPSSGISAARQGVSEKDFYKQLQRIFPNVRQGVLFKNPDFSQPYSADFALVLSSGLSIDIEVDEPYVGNTKAPHHCIDRGKDDARNKFFISGNWVVVRFSERQVVVSPQSCCKVIADLIARTSGDYTFLSMLSNVPDLAIEPMWTIIQAKKMARNDYRKTYLPRT